MYIYKYFLKTVNLKVHISAKIWHVINKNFIMQWNLIIGYIHSCGESLWTWQPSPLIFNTSLNKPMQNEIYTTSGAQRSKLFQK